MATCIHFSFLFSSLLSDWPWTSLSATGMAFINVNVAASFMKTRSPPWIICSCMLILRRCPGLLWPLCYSTLIRLWIALITAFTSHFFIKWVRSRWVRSGFWKKVPLYRMKHYLLCQIRLSHNENIPCWESDSNVEWKKSCLPCFTASTIWWDYDTHGFARGETLREDEVRSVTYAMWKSIQ